MSPCDSHSERERCPDIASVSVVIPVFNSEKILPLLVRRLALVLAGSARTYETILVNDGSTDESWRVISELHASYTWIRGIDLMRNYGQHSALLAGVRAARGAIVVTMDDDLQNPPEEIPRLVASLSNTCDLVYGVPRRKSQGTWRQAASRITRAALRPALGAELAAAVSPFRAFRAQIRDSLQTYSSPFVMLDVLLAWATDRYTTILVDHEPRASGASTYTLGKLVLQALNLFTGFSVFPLRVASVIGFAFALLGLAILLYVLVSYLAHGGSVPGFAFLASIIAIFSGAQLFALGIIGEYLSRVHSGTMGRPTYVVRQTLEKPGRELRQDCVRADAQTSDEARDIGGIGENTHH